MLYESCKLPSLNGEAVLECYVTRAMDAINTDARKPAVVICPGGGYHHLSPREGEPVALRLNAAGVNAYVLTYRLAPDVRWPAPLMDLAAAVAFVRGHAQEHHTDPRRIAVMGFSAGGHLAASLGVRWHEEGLFAPVGLTPEQVRPNAMVLCYPVITGGLFAHRGSFRYITGTEELSIHEGLSVDDMVTEHTPPTFLWHTWEDESVPVENSLMMASALRKAGVSTELHVYQHGAHGLALCDETTTNAALPWQLVPDNAGWFPLALRFLQRL